jgi:hypothetical protein
MDLKLAKVWASSSVRNEPEIFIFTFIILRSCLARFLVKGTSKSVRSRSVSVLNVFSFSSRLWPSRCLGRPRAGLLREFGQLTMEGEAEPNRFPISLD